MEENNENGWSVKCVGFFCRGILPTRVLCIRKLSAAGRGVYAASLSLIPQLSLNSNPVGSFTLKRSEGRAPTNRQLLDAPPRVIVAYCES